ncbi:MAG: hypothetical protein IKK59_01975 [Lachnospiraceae bacterium]|nr:hypothetical protein [Lachnospiraceae bacterium]
MGFFDDLKVLGSDLLAKSSVVAKEAAQKASDAADMAKIKVDIAAREREIKDLYAKIGKAYYDEYKDDAVEYAEDIAEINAKFALIGELKSKYEMYKDAMKSEKEEADVTVDAAPADVEDVIDIVPAKEE